jgi:hypothetical protein
MAALLILRLNSCGRSFIMMFPTLYFLDNGRCLPSDLFTGEGHQSTLIIISTHNVSDSYLGNSSTSELRRYGMVLIDELTVYNRAANLPAFLLLVPVLVVMESNNVSLLDFKACFVFTVMCYPSHASSILFVTMVMFSYCCHCQCANDVNFL